jgi:hypothetical protein
LLTKLVLPSVRDPLVFWFSARGIVSHIFADSKILAGNSPVGPPNPDTNQCHVLYGITKWNNPPPHRLTYLTRTKIHLWELVQMYENLGRNLKRSNRQRPRVHRLSYRHSHSMMMGVPH